jgi:2-hydroxychromene-2-carboxylate isomerase
LTGPATSAAARTTAPRFYISLRSPYSWLAYHDLTTRHADLTDLMCWRPFWEPDAWSQRLLTAERGRFVYTPMSREKHLYILQDVRRLAEARGLSVSWPIDRNPCWEVPHLAYLGARRRGLGREFIEAALRARWQEGRDICAPETVGRIAGGLGLDPQESATAAERPDMRAAGARCLLDVWRDGVFGVPFFVFGHEKYWGLDRLDAFAEAVRAGKLCTDAPAADPDAERWLAVVDAGEQGATADGGHAGGCG